jgi:hypothetical protein
VPQPAFHRPLKLALVVLLLIGVAMAIAAAVGALVHRQTGQLWVFVVVAVALAAVAALVARGLRWVIVLCFVALAGQIAAVAGTGIELVFGVADVKQRQLRALGFDPTIAVALNLAYSASGFLLFCWLAVRWWMRRRSEAGRPDGLPGRRT